MFDKLKEMYPNGFVARTEIKNATGGAISPRYMANLDSEGVGVPNAFRIGVKVCYPVDDLIN